MPVSDDPDDRSAPTQWYERPDAVLAAALVGLVAIGLLVFAVIQTSRHSTAPSGTDVPVTSTTTSLPTRNAKTTTTTTSYTTLTVTPSSLPTEPPSTEAPTVETTQTTQTTPGTTTMSIPYPTTTTPRANV
jgi:cytoskeletal protein RodZ